jgi:tetratricopeptide (TPR) repeat protein
MPIDAPVHVSTESLLMEGARRFDEWSRIVDKVPSLAVIPVLATVTDDHATRLDLLPSEWEVLATIDGLTDLRGLAATLGRSDFEVAKVMYGLVSTGVVELRDAGSTHVGGASAGGAADPNWELATAREALAAGRPDEALDAARRAIGAAPDDTAPRIMAAQALRRLRRYGEAADELRRAADAAPGLPEVHLELGYAAASRGDFREAVASWQKYLEESSAGAPGVAVVRDAIASATVLCTALEAHAGV